MRILNSVYENGGEDLPVHIGTVGVQPRLTVVYSVGFFFILVFILRTKPRWKFEGSSLLCLIMGVPDDR